MSREIRITVDDDEVFERMKRRKQALDLSWEEVLHRGLRHDPEPDAPSNAGPEPSPPHGRGPRDGPREQPDRRAEGGQYGREDRQYGRKDRQYGREDRWDAFAEGLESEIQNKVYDTLRSSFGAAGVEIPERESLGEDVAELERAEDATLTFEFLEDRPEYRVPLRANLRTGREGVDVEVVAVRLGKNVSETNRFDGDARKRVNAELASGETAILRFGDGEEYAVRPALAWSRDEDGRPRVSEVEITEVVFDDAR